MIIKPMVKGPMCFTAHPEGCKKNVLEEIDYVKSQEKVEGAKNVLVIGASTGYGLASRVVSTYACGAKTIGVFFEREAQPPRRTASAGLYNSAAFEEFAKNDGFEGWSINGDAFSDEIKEKTIKLIKEKMGKVDLIVYSLASPKRTHPKTGETYASTLKPIGEPFTTKAVNFLSGVFSEVTIDPASDDEIEKTVTVMGGEDWELWIEALKEADCIEKNATTVAFSYIGPVMTYPVYRHGTLGRAKEHLEATAFKLTETLSDIGGKAYVSVNKAVVTQASSAIPAVPLYIAMLYKHMKLNNIHEDCIEQIYRLYKDFLFTDKEVLVDDKGRIRIDDLEMREDIQKTVQDVWDETTEENVNDHADLETYKYDFYKLFGFFLSGIDYEKDVDPVAKIDLF